MGLQSLPEHQLSLRQYMSMWTKEIKAIVFDPAQNRDSYPTTTG
jgi:hypothetical protein